MGTQRAGVVERLGQFLGSVRFFVVATVTLIETSLILCTAPRCVRRVRRAWHARRNMMGVGSDEWTDRDVWE
jgi:hypothetical protein